MTSAFPFSLQLLFDETFNNLIATGLLDRSVAQYILTIIYGPGADGPALSSKPNLIVSFPGPSLMIGFPVFSEVWDQTYNGKCSADVRR